MTTKLRRLAGMMLAVLLSAVMGLAPISASAQEVAPGLKAYTNSFGPPISKSFTGTRVYTGNGVTASTAYPGYTWQQMIAAPGPFEAVRLIFANTTNAPVTIDAVACGSTSSIASYDNVSGTGISGRAAQWVLGKFLATGAASTTAGTMPANSNADITVEALAGGASYTNIPNLFYSDWMPCESVARTDGGTNPLILARAYISQATAIPLFGTNVSIPDWDDETKVGLVIQNRQKVGDFVTSNNSNFIFASEFPNNPIIGVEFSSRIPTITMLGVGDSKVRGQASTPDGYNYLEILANSVSTPTAPVYPAIYGWGGQQTSFNYSRWQKIFATGTKPQIAVFAPFSQNNWTGTASQVSSAQFAISSFLRACYERGIFPILVTGEPIGAVDDSSPTLQADNARKLVNTYIRSLESTSVGVFDNAAVMGDGATPERYNPAFVSSDHVHPNLAGHQAEAAAAKIKLQPILARIR